MVIFVDVVADFVAVVVVVFVVVVVAVFVFVAVVAIVANVVVDVVFLLLLFFLFTWQGSDTPKAKAWRIFDYLTSGKQSQRNFCHFGPKIIETDNSESSYDTFWF